MKTLIVSIGLLAAILSLAPPASAQTVTLTSTTLSAAVTSADSMVCLTSATGVIVPGVGVRGSTLFLSGLEPMDVRSVSPITATCFRVTRSTLPIGHASGASVYIGNRNQFYNHAPAGTCTLAGMAVRPWINLNAPIGESNTFDCVSSVWTAINGAATQAIGLTASTPNAAGTVDSGSALLPWRTVYFAGTSGTPATNNFKFAGASTSGTRVITVPDASITVSGATATDCGTAAGACSTTTTSATLKIVSGTASATSASPSTVAITGMPAFTSTATYKCFASNATTPANVFSVLTAGYVSTTAVTFTGPNTLTDTIRWSCVGY